MPESNQNNGAAPEPNSEDAPQVTRDEEDATPRPAGEAPAADPLEEAVAEAQRMKQQWMRCAADFDNFRKRSRRELEDTRKAGREELLKDVLPVFDNLERAIASAERATDVKPVAEGLKMVLRQFVDTIGRFGISKVPTIGNRFDPTIHEAIQQIETDEHPAGAIVAEVQPGYLQGDRLVRAAMVVVAKPTAKAAAATDDDGDNTEKDA